MQSKEAVNILLVDDQPEGLLALEATLERLKQNLVKARSGNEALRHLLSQEFAVILLDVQMPDMDGYETASLIRQNPTSRDTPIIFLTASHNADVQTIRGYAVGAVDYLFKPLEAEILRSKVSVFVELARKSAVIKRQATELIQREQEARQLAEVRAELLADLQQKNRDLEALNNELESFSYSVSHDLRAPLRSIGGFSQILLESSGDKLDDQGKHYIGRVRQAARHMSDLIEGLLALARVTRSDLHRQRLDLSQLAREVIRRIQEGAKDADRKVDFVVTEGLSVAADQRLLLVVLENLLGNAWKFTAKTEQARIELGETVDGSRRVFFVTDNGAGFAPEYAGNLFGAFRRLHSSKEFEGHGIGLATVQRVVRRHGGEIWAEGRVGAGATFYFTLGDDERGPTGTGAP